MPVQIITSELLEEDPSLIDLIDKFMIRFPVMYDAVLEAYNSEDWESFLGLIHQMKGVGGGYGYPMLTTLCADIEITTRDKDFVKLKNELDELNLLRKNILAGSDENHKIAEQAKP